MSKQITITETEELCYNCGMPLYEFPEELRCIQKECGMYKAKAPTALNQGDR